MGEELATHFLASGYEVVILTRGRTKNENGRSYIHWDAETESDWTAALEQSDVLINLTGKSVDCRYTEENKRLILESRVNATSVLQAALSKMKQKPSVWINASTATIYRHSLDTVMTEENGEYGDDFSMTVAKSWENAFFEKELEGVRKVAARISLVIGKNGGVYPVLRRLAKFGVAGSMGSGKQRFAWIHIDDLIRIFDYAVSTPSIEGPINCTSVSSPTNAEFMRALRKSLGAPIGIPQPLFALKLGALILGTESELLLKSRYVYPKKLVDQGFEFKYEDCQEALNSLNK